MSNDLNAIVGLLATLGIATLSGLYQDRRTRNERLISQSASSSEIALTVDEQPVADFIEPNGSVMTGGGSADRAYAQCESASSRLGSAAALHTSLQGGIGYGIAFGAGALMGLIVAGGSGQNSGHREKRRLLARIADVENLYTMALAKIATQEKITGIINKVLRKHLEEHKDKAAKLRCQLKDTARASTLWETKFNAFKEEFDAANEECDKLKATQRGNDDLISQQQRHMTALQDEIIELTRKLEEKDVPRRADAEEIAKLKEDVTGLKDDQHTKNSLISHQEQEIADLRKQVADLQDEKGDVLAAASLTDSQLQRQTTEIASLQKQVTDLQEEKGDVLAAASLTESQLQRQTNEIASLQKQANERDILRNYLHNAQADARGSRKELEELKTSSRRTRDAYENVLKNQKTAKEKANERADAAEQKNKELQHMLDDEKSKAREAQAQLQKLKTEETEQQRKIDKPRTDNKTSMEAEQTLDELEASGAEQAIDEPEASEAEHILDEAEASDASSAEDSSDGDTPPTTNGSKKRRKQRKVWRQRLDPATGQHYFRNHKNGRCCTYNPRCAAHGGLVGDCTTSAWS